jgi:hypothetical protein
LRERLGVPDIAKQFYEKQWSVPPILLKEHQEFPCREFIFPFDYAPQQVPDRSYSWGEIFAVEIAEGCLQLPDNLEEEYTPVCCLKRPCVFSSESNIADANTCLYR